MKDFLKRPKIFNWTATPASYYLKEQDIHIDSDLEELIVISMLLERSLMQEKLNMTKIYNRTKECAGDPLFNSSGVFEQYLDIHMTHPFKLQMRIKDDYVEASLYSTHDTHLTKEGFILYFKTAHISQFVQLYLQTAVFLQINKDVYQNHFTNLKLLDPLFSGMEDALILCDNENINESILWIQDAAKHVSLNGNRVKIQIKDPTTYFGKSVMPQSKYKGLN